MFSILSNLLHLQKYFKMCNIRMLKSTFSNPLSTRNTPISSWFCNDRWLWLSQIIMRKCHKLDLVITTYWSLQNLIFIKSQSLHSIKRAVIFQIINLWFFTMHDLEFAKHHAPGYGVFLCIGELWILKLIFISYLWNQKSQLVFCFFTLIYFLKVMVLWVFTIIITWIWIIILLRIFNLSTDYWLPSATKWPKIFYIFRILNNINCSISSLARNITFLLSPCFEFLSARDTWYWLNSLILIYLF